MRTNRGQTNFLILTKDYKILLRNIFTKDESYTGLVMFTNNVKRVNFDCMWTLKIIVCFTSKFMK